MRRGTGLTIRWAGAADGAALARLAALDSAPPLGGPALVAEVDGEPVAAIAVDDGRTVADPFVHTAEVVELVALRASQLAAARAQRPPALGRLVGWPRATRSIASRGTSRPGSATA